MANNIPAPGVTELHHVDSPLMYGGSNPYIAQPTGGEQEFAPTNPISMGRMHDGSGMAWSQEGGSSVGGDQGLRKYQGGETEVTAPAVHATIEQASGRSIGMTGSGLAFEAGTGHVADATGRASSMSGGVATPEEQAEYTRTAGIMNKENYGKKGAKTYMAFNPYSSQQSPDVLSRMAAQHGSPSSMAARISNDASENEPSKVFEISANAKGNYPISGNPEAQGYANSQEGGSEENLQKLPLQDEQRARGMKSRP